MSKRGHHPGSNGKTAPATPQEGKDAQDEITRIYEFLDAIFENLPNMVFVKEAKDLRFVRFNKAGEKLLGYDRKDMLGKNDFDFFPPEQAAFFTQKDREALNSHDVTDIPEEPIETKTGPRWLHTKKIPIRDTHGTPLFLLGISEDITEQKKAQQQVNSLYKELERKSKFLEASNKEISSFSYIVSHDLRAPIRAIHGYTKLLESHYSNQINKEGTEWLHKVSEAATRMGHLIDDLIEFSKIGRKDVQKSTVNMTVMAKEIAAHMTETITGAAKPKITIHELPEAQADKDLIFQVWISLIENAIKFSSGKQEPIIEIGARSEEGCNVYYVKDNGAGFDMKYYNKLFNVFQRLHHMHEFPGAGMGLAVAQRIVIRHDGKMWAEGKVNEGATFYFSLPR